MPEVCGPNPSWRVFAIRTAQSLASTSTRAVWDDFTHITTIDVAASPELHPSSDLWMIRSLPRLLRSLDADVLYSPAYLSPPSTGRTARVVMIHDDLIWAEPQSYPLPFRLYLGTGTRWSAARAHRVVFPSADARDRVAARLGLSADRLGVVPHGIDPTSYAEYTLSDRRPVAVFVASAEHRKNHAVLLESLPKIHSEVTFHFLGFRPDQTRLEGLRRQHSRGWEVTPSVTTQEVGKELGSALMMVHPSRGEGFGLPLLEAMACGTPMILSDIPVLREVAGEAALYVPPDDAAGWAQAVDRLAGDPNLAADLVAKGTARLKQFTLEGCARQLLANCDAAIGASE